MSISNLFKLG